MGVDVITRATDNRTVQLDGERVAGLRRARGLTREQLAEAADGPHRLSEATLKRAERGARVYLETARRLAGLFEVPLHALLAGDDDISGAPNLGRGDADGPLGVAVLPLRALGGDAQATVLADGLSEDLTTRLGGWWFPVISRGSTVRYTDAASATEVAADLHVGYLVEGSVQRVGDAVRVRARLVTAATGAQLWAAESTRPIAQLFRLQDELTAGIVEGINHKLLTLTQRRFADRDPQDLQAWELAVRGSASFYDGTRSANAAARELLRTALQRDPDLSWAFYLLGMTYQRDMVNQWTDDPRTTLARFAEVSAEYERRHRDDGRSRLLSAYLSIYRGERQRAVDEVQHSLQLTPNLNLGYSLLGQALAMGAEPDAALEQFEIAIRLSPRDADLWTVRVAVALTHIVSEDYAEARRWAQDAVALHPQTPFAHCTLAAAAALSGDVAAAREVGDTVRRLHPGFSIAQLKGIQVSTHPDIAARFVAGLVQAGF